MDNKRKGLIAALALGLVSGPAIALGITGLLGSDTASASAAEAPVAVTITTEAPTTTIAPTVPTSDPAADLLTACVVDGPALVASETAGTITDVEQAALDALRDICGNSGLALADPAAAETASAPVVVRTVTVSAAAPAATSGGDDDGHEEHEEGEHEEEEHEQGEDD